MVLKEMHISQPSPPTLWCDNSRALALASNPVFHARTKHIEVDVHFVHEKVANRDIQLHHLSTLEQLTDIFTKGHGIDRFCYLRDKLKVVPPLSLRGSLRGVLRITLQPKILTNQFIHNQKKTPLLIVLPLQSAAHTTTINQSSRQAEGCFSSGSLHDRLLLVFWLFFTSLSCLGAASVILNSFLVFYYVLDFCKVSLLYECKSCASLL